VNLRRSAYLYRNGGLAGSMKLRVSTMSFQTHRRIAVKRVGPQGRGHRQFTTRLRRSVAAFSSVFDGGPPKTLRGTGLVLVQVRIEELRARCASPSTHPPQKLIVICILDRAGVDTRRRIPLGLRRCVPYPPAGCPGKWAAWIVSPSDRLDATCAPLRAHYMKMKFGLSES
jgi:hypothetical protein